MTSKQVLKILDELEFKYDFDKDFPLEIHLESSTVILVGWSDKVSEIHLIPNAIKDLSEIKVIKVINKSNEYIKNVLKNIIKKEIENDIRTI